MWAGWMPVSASSLRRLSWAGALRAGGQHLPCQAGPLRVPKGFLFWFLEAVVGQTVEQKVSQEPVCLEPKVTP